MKIAVLVDDLFFSSKISAVSKHLGSEVVFCHGAAGVPPDVECICVDLNASSFDAVEEIRRLKASHSAPILAYVSHVQVDLRRQAEQAGADEVMARSAFVERLPKILAGDH